MLYDSILDMKCNMILIYDMIYAPRPDPRQGSIEMAFPKCPETRSFTEMMYDMIYDMMHDMTYDMIMA